MKKFISLVGITLALVVSVAPAHAAFLPEEAVAQILGTRMPPSKVVVGTTDTPPYNSVHGFDNLLNLTNRVLDRSIRQDLIRIHTNLVTTLVNPANAQRNFKAVQDHCISRLTADGIASPASECGDGSTRN